MTEPWYRAPDISLIGEEHVNQYRATDGEVGYVWNDAPTLLLYGPDDHVVGPDFLAFCEVAYTNRIGPLVVQGAGHFLQWERADVLNPLVSAFFGDLRVRFARKA